MSTTKPALVAEALLARVASIDTGSPSLPIAWPESPDTFEPPVDGRYLEVADFTNEPFWQGLSSGRIDQGILLVTVVWPKNQGLIAPKDMAGAVMAHFPKGLTLNNGIARVKVQSEPFQASPIIETDKVRIPVTVRWTA